MKDLQNNSKNFDNRPIGFFDSGVGGLTVLDKVQKLLPNENYIYFGDTKNMPYGEKSEAQLLNFADKIFKFFENKNVKAVVMACNTTSAVTYDKLKNNYNFKIYPIIQSVSKVLSKMDIKNIGIFATDATINSHCYKKEITKYNSNINVYEIACPEWVKIVEDSQEGTSESDKLVKEKLDEMLKNSPDKIVLGCTHYPYLIDTLAKFAQKDLFIDPAINFAQYIKEDMKKYNMLSSSNDAASFEFYVSSSPENFKIAGEMFFDMKKAKINLTY
ncbi:MAG: glutamate racemase [Clostridiaceae bacterium]|jgi:glutamate racemase|nr:glutamate racemase [Clostridiaceae bacterium]